MHSASKRKNNPPPIHDWCHCHWCGSSYGCDCYYDDYDDDYMCSCCYGSTCNNWPCSCCGKEELKEIHHIVAKAYADRIIVDTVIGWDIKNFIVRERLMHYSSFTSPSADQNFKEDLIFAWKMIKDTAMGPTIFANIFGAQDEDKKEDDSE